MKNIVTGFLLLISSFCIAQNKAFQVKVTGKGQPMLLLPGYSCTGEVWDETVEHLKDKYELHVLTLAGFGGVARIDTPILKTVHNEIIEYVKANKLQKPLLMGHSLGAFMSLWVASSQPDLFGKLICVDGVPFISAMMNPALTEGEVKANPQFDRKTTVENFVKLPENGYEKQMEMSMRSQVNDTNYAKKIAHWSFLSDRATLGNTIIDISTTDLRSSIAKIQASTLVLGSLYGNKENSERILNEQYKLLPNKKIVVAESKHFIMYDVPHWFYSQIDSFLNQ
jgi:N-formylmaleamate deformylase